MFQSPFVVGLAIGLAIALLILFSKWSKCWKLNRQIKTLYQQNVTLTTSAASVASATADEIKKLKEQVTNQKITIELLREKPDKKELRELRLYATAYEMMVERAPGFAQAWQTCIREIKQKEEEETSGFRIFTRPIQKLCQNWFSGKIAHETAADVTPSIAGRSKHAAENDPIRNDGVRKN